MNGARFVYTDFCDDVREEVGGKFSLIGVYRSDLIVKKIPIVLPKFCIVVRIVTPIDCPFSLLKIRMSMNGELLADMAIPDNVLQTKQSITDGRDGKRMQAMTILSLAPLAINEPGKITIEVETEEGVLYGGSLWIKLLESESAN